MEAAEARQLFLARPLFPLQRPLQRLKSLACLPSPGALLCLYHVTSDALRKETVLKR
jgi:hypothetical protein